MLNPKSIPGKTYEGLMEENYGKIPIYTDEWTNFNPADPGITILENLSAFQIIQNNSMDVVTPAVRAKLLELLGYKSRRGKGAEVYVEPRGIQEDLDIPADQRFMVGNISYETTIASHITANHLIGLYGRDRGGFHNYSYILDRDVTLQAYIFGKEPRADMELYFVMDAPFPSGEKSTVYVSVDDRYRRNPFQEDDAPKFAELIWECYTEKGFVPMSVTDKTHGFLVDGYISFEQPQEVATRYEADEFAGYVWRLTLKKAEYDIPPMIRYMSGFLFSVVQKETRVIAHSFQKPRDVVLESTMLETCHVKVFGKEEKGTSYRMYQEAQSEGIKGRYYRRIRQGFGKFEFQFDKVNYGYEPLHVRNAVKIVLYNEEMMRKYYLGDVYGFERQEIDLPAQHVVTETFSLIAERTLENGEKIYDFLKPGREGEKEMLYYLYENEGKIVIINPGNYIGARLYLGSIAVTLGQEGNLRAGNVFSPIDLKEAEQIHFFNPAAGVHGCFQETLEDVRKRFIHDMNTPETAVLLSDYEALVNRTPGLCIKKSHAWMDYDKNEVQLVVQPGTRSAFPQLSENYRREIEKWIEERRLLATRIRVRQPVYTAVLTSGTIYVKPHYEHCREQIEKVIMETLDYVNGEQQFGQTLRFDRLFHEIEALDCVSYIYELSISPQNTVNATVDTADVVPGQNCLLYPGSIKLDILPSPEGMKM